MKLGYFSEAIIILGNAMTKAQKNVEVEKKRQIFFVDVQKSLKFSSSKKSASLKMENFNKDEEEMKNLPMLTGINPQMPAFSKAIKICHSSKVIKIMLTMV